MGLTWRSVSKPTELFAYGMEFAVTAILVSNIFQFGVWRTIIHRHSLPFWLKWRPCLFLGAAVPLTTAQPLTTMIVYHFELAKMWKGGSWWPNTPLGVVLLLMSYIGFICLTIGVVTITNMHTKIAKRWRKLRKTSNKAKVESNTNNGNDLESGQQ